MFSLKSMLKLAGGGLGPEEIQELLSGLGLDLTFAEAAPAEREAAFRCAASAAIEPGSKVLAIRGKDKDGGRIEGLLVLAPGAKPLPFPAKKALTPDAL